MCCILFCWWHVAQIRHDINLISSPQPLPFSPFSSSWTWTALQPSCTSQLRENQRGLIRLTCKGLALLQNSWPSGLQTAQTSRYDIHRYPPSHTCACAKKKITKHSLSKSPYPHPHVICVAISHISNTPALVGPKRGSTRQLSRSDSPGPSKITIKTLAPIWKASTLNSGAFNLFFPTPVGYLDRGRTKAAGGRQPQQ